MKKIIKKFQIEYLQILDKDGNSSKPPLSTDQIKEIYALMIKSRTFDKKALALQRQGRLGTYAQVLGQEAAQVGVKKEVKKMVKAQSLSNERSKKVADIIPQIQALFGAAGGGYTVEYHEEDGAHTLQFRGGLKIAEDITTEQSEKNILKFAKRYCARLITGDQEAALTRKIMGV